MLNFYKYFIKKKKFYYSLVLYFIFLTNNILLFYRTTNLNYEKLLKPIIHLGFKYLKLNSSNVFPISNISNFILNIFKNDFLLIYMNSFCLLTKLLDSKLLLNIVMISINYHFLNLNYINKINTLFKLFNLNLIVFCIYQEKLFYILISYKKKLEKLILN
jgi:hypothetical protein